MYRNFPGILLDRPLPSGRYPVNWATTYNNTCTCTCVPKRKQAAARRATPAAQRRGRGGGAQGASVSPPTPVRTPKGPIVDRSTLQSQNGISLHDLPRLRSLFPNFSTIRFTFTTTCGFSKSISTSPGQFLPRDAMHPRY